MINSSYSKLSIPFHASVMEMQINSHSHQQMESSQINVGNSSMNTPLHIAVKHYKNGSIAQLLSCEKCDPNAYNREGNTPLHIAIREKRAGALSQMLAHKQCDPKLSSY